MQQPGDNANQELSLGTAIEVRDHFCAIWCSGFEVAGSTERGYLVRRIVRPLRAALAVPAHEVRRRS